MPEPPAKHGREHHADGPDPTVHSVAWPFKIFADAQIVTSGDGKLFFEIPFDLDEWSLVFVRIYVSTVSSSGLVTVQIANVTQGHDLLSTKATIDSGEQGSRTAAAPPVINAGNAQVFDGDLMRFDVDGAGTGAKGLGATLWFDLIAV